MLNKCGLSTWFATVTTARLTNDVGDEVQAISKSTEAGLFVGSCTTYCIRGFCESGTKMPGANKKGGSGEAGHQRTTWDGPPNRTQIVQQFRLGVNILHAGGAWHLDDLQQRGRSLEQGRS